MLADNYILEKDNMEDYTNKFSEKKIIEVNDGNAGSYNNGTIKYQLSQIFNLNSVMNFREGLLIIPLTLDFKISGTAVNAVLTPENIRRLVGIKSGSLVNSVRIRVNGKSAVSYENNLNEIMEFNFLTSCLSGNNNEWSRSMNSLLDEKYLLYTGTTNEKDLLLYQKFYKNTGAALNNTKETDLLIENNKLLITRETNNTYDALNDYANYANERQNYVSNVTATTVNGVAYQNATIFYYVGIKLSQIHDLFDKMAISRAFVDFEIDLNLGTSTIAGTTLAATKNLNDLDLVQSHNFNRGTSSIYFNVDGIERNAIDNVWWKLNGIAVVSETILMEATLNIDKNAGTKLSMPIYKIKPEFNELYIKDSVRTIKYTDYLYYNLNNITSGSTTNFTISNAVSNCKYLLMIPQLLKNKVNCLNQSIIANGPILLSNLQLMKGSSVFNQPLIYTYDMFLNYIENNNNMNGGKDWVNNLFNFNNFNKLYRLYFFDLTLINNQKDVAYNLTVQFINKCKLPINVDFYVFEEKELIFNKINGVIGDVQ
jgi:hypothetical protein